jgi:Flp pilus assembly secretin CpaC
MKNIYFTQSAMQLKPATVLERIIRLMMAGSVVAGLSIATSALNAAQGAEVLRIVLNKTSLLEFDLPMKSIILGKSQIADVTMESRRLLLVTGNSVGETNLTILGQQGRPIASYDVVVVPATSRHVTIHRTADTVATYSCLPRCTVVKSPDGTELSTKAPKQEDETVSEGAAANERESFVTERTSVIQGKIGKRRFTATRKTSGTLKPASDNQ